MCDFCNGQTEICPSCGGNYYGLKNEKIMIDHSGVNKTPRTEWNPREKTYLIPLFVEQIAKEIRYLDNWINETKTGGWSTQNLEQMKKRSKDLKVFLYDLGY